MKNQRQWAPIGTLGSLKILAMGTFILSYKLFFYYKPVIYTKTLFKTLTNKTCSWAQEIFYAFTSTLQRHEVLENFSFFPNNNIALYVPYVEELFSSSFPFLSILAAPAN